MPTIGYATLQIIPSLRGISDAIDKEFAKETRGRTPKIPFTIDEAAARQSGQRIGKKVAEGLGAAQPEINTRAQKIGETIGTIIGKPIGLAITGLKTGVAGAAAGVTGVLAAALTKGFDRLKSIDDAKFKLQALGHSAAEVQQIMDSALASVKGTSFALNDAATAAASAVAAGIQPGQQLTQYLKEIGDSAAIAGTSFEDMGHIFNKVQTQNKAYTDDLQMLSDRGVPIFTWLQQEYGVTGAALQKMVEKGQVDAAHFQDAIQKHIGGAALTMGQSFSGSVQNAEAALARLGAAFLQPVFGNFAGGIGSVTSGLDGLTAWITAHQSEIIDFWKTLGDFAITGAENVAHGVGGMLQALGDMAGGIGNVKGVLDDLMGDVASLKGDDAGAAAFHKSAQEAYGWGESLRAAGDKLVNLNLDSARGKLDGWADSAKNAAAESRNAAGEAANLGSALGVLPNSKKISVEADTTPAEQTMQTWWAKWKSVIAAAPGGDNTDQWVIGPTDRPPASVGGPPPAVPSLLDPNRPKLGQHATGGSISGPGGPKSDIIPIWASNGEHVLSASDVQAMGGQAGVYAFRSMLHRSGGGEIWPLAILPAPKDPGRNADRSRPSDRGGDRGPRGDIWRKGPFNYAGDVPGLSIWPGGTGSSTGRPPTWWWVPGKGLIKPPWEPKIPLDPWIWNRKGVKGLGAGLGFAGGGAVGGMTVDQLKQFAAGISGHGYVWGGGNGDTFDTDCSGAQSTIANYITGGKGRFATASEASALLSRGFKIGDPPPGVAAYWVGWRNGGPGGGHTAGTIVDPTGGSINVEMGGAARSGQFGGRAAGAAGFPDRAWIAIASGDDPSKNNFGSGSSPFAGGSAAAAVTGPAVSAAPEPAAAASSSISVPSSISGLAGWGLSNLGAGIGKTGSGSDLSLFGNAAASAVSGQVSSALGVLGVSDTPGWLKGISQLVGGISIGGGGSSASPLAATSNFTGTPAPDGVHGTRAGQPPGPGVTYNIQARDTEDAFIKAQRVERERAAAKLDRF